MKGLAYQETARILRRIGPDDRLVLIGGQAVNYWASRYSNSESELLQHAPYTSKDVDFCGSQESLARCAARLHGTSELYTMDQRTAAFGVVRFRDSVGEERWIDVMRSPFGLSTQEVMDGSIPVDVLDEEGHPTGVSFRVMHPVLCMESRVANVVGLPDQYNNDHGVRQMNASIVCARAFLRELLDGDRTRDVLDLNERIFRFCLRNEYGRRALAFGDDPFNAVLRDARLGAFLTKRYPRMVAQLAAARSTRD